MCAAARGAFNSRSSSKVDEYENYYLTAFSAPQGEKKAPAVRDLRLSGGAARAGRAGPGVAPLSFGALGAPWTVLLLVPVLPAGARARARGLGLRLGRVT